MKAGSVNNIPHNLTDLFSTYGYCKAILNIQNMQKDDYTTKRTYISAVRRGRVIIFTNNALFLASYAYP